MYFCLFYTQTNRQELMLMIGDRLIICIKFDVFLYFYAHMCNACILLFSNKLSFQSNYQFNSYEPVSPLQYLVITYYDVTRIFAILVTFRSHKNKHIATHRIYFIYFITLYRLQRDHANHEMVYPTRI